jgi:hypothetical protein
VKLLGVRREIPGRESSWDRLPSGSSASAIHGGRWPLGKTTRQCSPAIHRDRTSGWPASGPHRSVTEGGAREEELRCGPGLSASTTGERGDPRGLAYREGENGP